MAAIRQDQKMTQMELAKRSGMKQPQIARIERLTNSPHLNTILKALEPLGYTLDIVPMGEWNG